MKKLSLRLEKKKQNQMNHTGVSCKERQQNVHIWERKGFPH